MNHLAILVSVIVQQIIGMTWYGIFGEKWVASLGKSMEEFHNNPDPTPYIVGIISSVALAHGTSYLFRLLKVETLGAGIKFSFFFFAFFVLFTTATHTYFAHLSKITLSIDMGHTLLCFLSTGAILAVWKKKN